MSIEPTENVGTHLMFENDRVRVWDLALAPGEWLERHIHREDFFFIVVDGGHMKMVDPDDPEAAPAFDYADDQVVFIEANGGTVHQRPHQCRHEAVPEPRHRTQIGEGLRGS